MSAGGLETVPERWELDLVWSDRDVLLYALSVGAGQADPYAELDYTLERPGRPPAVLPGFAVTLAHRSTETAQGELELARIVHAEQAVTLHTPLPVAGRAWVQGRRTGVYDKGSGALVVAEASVVDAGDGTPLFDTRSSMFVRGLGGFGGARGPRSEWTAPAGEPDVSVTAPTRPDQALLYRLNGDRNPLHADPEFARDAGFERPILHGLCTYGIAGRLLVEAVCESAPERVRGLSTRFAAPVVPGEALRVDAWTGAGSGSGSGEVLFRASVGGRIVLDHGRLEVSPEPTVDRPPAGPASP